MFFLINYDHLCPQSLVMMFTYWGFVGLLALLSPNSTLTQHVSHTVQGKCAEVEKTEWIWQPKFMPLRVELTQSTTWGTCEEKDYWELVRYHCSNVSLIQLLNEGICILCGLFLFGTKAVLEDTVIVILVIIFGGLLFHCIVFIPFFKKKTYDFMFKRHIFTN